MSGERAREVAARLRTDAAHASHSKRSAIITIGRDCADGASVITSQEAEIEALREGNAHRCGRCAVGSHAGQIELVPPEFLRRADGRGICVDVCLALEISDLWRSGIKTTGCCCGHGEAAPYIGVTDEHIEAMKALGYAVQPNPLRPGDEDSFAPKTRLAPPPPARHPLAGEGGR